MSFKTLSGKELYRIGDCIISTNSQNPSINFGGKWELLCPGRTIVCVDVNDGDFNTLKKVGGNKYLQSHNHSASSGYVSNDHSHYLSLGTSWGGDHTHKFSARDVYSGGSTWAGAVGAGIGYTDRYNTTSAGGHSHTINGSTGGISSNHTHSISVSNNGSGNSQNLQPFMAVYIWVRVA